MVMMADWLIMMMVYDDDVGNPKEFSPTSEKVVNNNPLEGHSLQHNSLPKEWK